MSSITDGISSVNSLTTQISSLKENAANAKASADPNAVIFNLQQNFNEMLNELVSSSDQDKEKEQSDPFSFLFTNYQTEINNINKQNSQTQTAADPSSESSLNINSYTGSIDNDLSQNIDQSSLLQNQYQLNLDNLF